MSKCTKDAFAFINILFQNKDKASSSMKLKDAFAFYVMHYTTQKAICQAPFLNFFKNLSKTRFCNDFALDKTVLEEYNTEK